MGSCLFIFNYCLTFFRNALSFSSEKLDKPFPIPNLGSLNNNPTIN